MYLVRRCCNTWSCTFLIHNKYLWLKRNSKFENTLRNSNCNAKCKRLKSAKIYECWMKKPTSPTRKIHTFASKHFGWNFVLGQTSSNIIQHDFFLLFRNFINFVIAQTIPTFHHSKNVMLDEIFDWFASALGGLKMVLKMYWYMRGRGIPWKKVFLKISQNSQENNCA